MRKSPIYITISASISNLIPLFYIFNLIYIKNPFNFNLILLNCLIKSSLTFKALIASILIFKTALLLYS